MFKKLILSLVAVGAIVLTGLVGTTDKAEAHYCVPNRSSTNIGGDGGWEAYYIDSTTSHVEVAQFVLEAQDAYVPNQSSSSETSIILGPTGEFNEWIQYGFHNFYSDTGGPPKLYIQLVAPALGQIDLIAGVNADPAPVGIIEGVEYVLQIRYNLSLDRVDYYIGFSSEQLFLWETTGFGGNTTPITDVQLNSGIFGGKRTQVMGTGLNPERIGGAAQLLYGGAWHTMDGSFYVEAEVPAGVFGYQEIGNGDVWYYDWYCRNV